VVSWLSQHEQVAAASFILLVSITGGIFIFMVWDNQGQNAVICLH
jgi:hypothetical protein